MKRIIYAIVFMISTLTFAQEHMPWVNIEKAQRLAKDNPKNILLYIHSYDCGWCAELNKTSWEDEEVIKLVEEHYYPVKFYAYYPDPVLFQGKEFRYVQVDAEFGAHQLPLVLLQGEMNFPAIAILDSEARLVHLIKGFEEKEALVDKLLYLGDSKYQDMTWDAFMELKRLE